MNELVSIIMPSFNSEKFIHESIESVIAQTYTNWELLIIDDGSKNKVEDIISHYLEDPRIKVYYNIYEKGAANCRNYGLQLAKGKWISFLDSDDLWCNSKLEKQIDFMKKNKYSFSYTKYISFDENENFLVVSGPKKITKSKMLAYCWPGCLTVMYDAEKIGLIKIQNIKKHNDYAMWLKIIEKSNCYLLEDTLSFYRKHENSISSSSKITLIKYHYYLFRYCLKNSVILAIVHTIVNIFFGVYKKIIYVKKIDVEGSEFLEQSTRRSN